MYNQKQLSRFYIVLFILLFNFAFKSCEEENKEKKRKDDIQKLVNNFDPTVIQDKKSWVKNEKKDIYQKVLERYLGFNQNIRKYEEFFIYTIKSLENKLIYNEINKENPFIIKQEPALPLQPNIIITLEAQALKEQEENKEALQKHHSFFQEILSYLDFKLENEATNFDVDYDNKSFTICSKETHLKNKRTILEQLIKYEISYLELHKEVIKSQEKWLEYYFKYLDLPVYKWKKLDITAIRFREELWPTLNSIYPSYLEKMIMDLTHFLELNQNDTENPVPTPESQQQNPNTNQNLETHYDLFYHKNLKKILEPIFQIQSIVDIKKKPEEVSTNWIDLSEEDKPNTISPMKVMHMEAQVSETPEAQEIKNYCTIVTFNAEDNNLWIKQINEFLVQME